MKGTMTPTLLLVDMQGEGFGGGGKAFLNKNQSRVCWVLLHKSILNVASYLC